MAVVGRISQPTGKYHIGAKSSCCMNCICCVGCGFGWTLFALMICLFPLTFMAYSPADKLDIAVILTTEHISFGFPMKEGGNCTIPGCEQYKGASDVPGYTSFGVVRLKDRENWEWRCLSRCPFNKVDKGVVDFLGTRTNHTILDWPKAVGCPELMKGPKFWQEVARYSNWGLIGAWSVLTIATVWCSVVCGAAVALSIVAHMVANFLAIHMMSGTMDNNVCGTAPSDLVKIMREGNGIHPVEGAEAMTLYSAMAVSGMTLVAWLLMFFGWKRWTTGKYGGWGGSLVSQSNDCGMGERQWLIHDT